MFRPVQPIRSIRFPLILLKYCLDARKNVNASTFSAPLTRESDFEPDSWAPRCVWRPRDDGFELIESEDLVLNRGSRGETGLIRYTDLVVGLG